MYKLIWNMKLIRIIWSIIILLLMGVFLLGCRSEPRPVEVVDVVPPVSEENSVSTPLAADPTIAAILAATETARPAVEEMPTATETAVLCGPPEDWVEYIVQPNDTLFSLAALTGVAVADIKSANCKLDDLLDVGETIYLPALPPPPPPPISVIGSDPIVQQNEPNPPTDPGRIIVPFGGNEAGLATLVKAQSEPVPPSTPPLSPCHYTDGTPQILANTNSQELGERKTYIVCNVPENPLFATITGPASENSYQVQLNVIQRLDSFELDWAAGCTLSPGIYTLSIESEETIKGEIIVSQPENPRILAIPNALKLGQSLDMHYCGFTDKVNQQITVDLFRTTSGCSGSACLEHAASWPVDIGTNGTAVQTLFTTATDPPGTYYLLDHEELMTKFSGAAGSESVIIGRYDFETYFSRLEKIYLNP